MVFLLYKYSTGQTILNESFDNTTFVPTGWYQARTNPTGTMTWGYWDRVSSATVATHSGSGMARFNSPSNGFGTITELGTPALDFSDGKSYRVKYWMYRSANAPLSQDLLEIYVNQATSVTGATKLGENYGTRM